VSLSLSRLWEKLIHPREGRKTGRGLEQNEAAVQSCWTAASLQLRPRSYRTRREFFVALLI